MRTEEQIINEYLSWAIDLVKELGLPDIVPLTNKSYLDIADNIHQILIDWHKMDEALEKKINMKLHEVESELADLMEAEEQSAQASDAQQEQGLREMEEETKEELMSEGLEDLQTEKEKKDLPEGI